VIQQFLPILIVYTILSICVFIPKSKYLFQFLISHEEAAARWRSKLVSLRRRFADDLAAVSWDISVVQKFEITNPAKFDYPFWLSTTARQKWRRLGGTLLLENKTNFEMILQ